MKAIVKIAFAVISITLVACTQNYVAVRTDKTEHIRINTKPYYEPKVEESYISGDYGAYQSFLAESDNVIAVSSSKNGPLSEHIRYGYLMPFDESKNKVDVNYDVVLNGKPFPINELTKSNNNLETIFGNTAEFKVSFNTKSDQEEGTSVNMYIPEEISITSPYIQSEQDLLPLCYYKNFQIGWNLDENNINGVIAIVEWIGETVIGNDFPSTHIRRICVFEDTGNGTFAEEMFNDIPDAAVCHLTLLRGNIELLELDGMSYKIFGESHQFLSFVLIRAVKER